MVICTNVFRTSVWLFRLGQDNVGGSVGGATNVEILNRTTSYKFTEESRLNGGETL
jgi:hypothetical protein